jgi:hypothetical protein
MISKIGFIDKTEFSPLSWRHVAPPGGPGQGEYATKVSKLVTAGVAAGGVDPYSAFMAVNVIVLTVPNGRQGIPPGDRQGFAFRSI